MSDPNTPAAGQAAVLPTDEELRQISGKLAQVSALQAQRARLAQDLKNVEASLARESTVLESMRGCMHVVSPMAAAQAK